jgi:hypothetical protein
MNGKAYIRRSRVQAPHPSRIKQKGHPAGWPFCLSESENQLLDLAFFAGAVSALPAWISYDRLPTLSGGQMWPKQM